MQSEQHNFPDGYYSWSKSCLTQPNQVFQRTGPEKAIQGLLCLVSGLFLPRCMAKWNWDENHFGYH